MGHIVPEDGSELLRMFVPLKWACQHESHAVQVHQMVIVVCCCLLMVVYTHTKLLAIRGTDEVVQRATATAVDELTAAVRLGIVEETDGCSGTVSLTHAHIADQP